MSTDFTWSCPMCTLLNNSSANTCTLCGAQRNQTNDVNMEVLNSQANLITSLKPQQQIASTSMEETNKISHFNYKEDVIENENNKDDIDYEFEDDEFDDDNAFENDTGNSGQNDNEEKVEYEFEEDDDNVFEDDDGWGDDDELCYDDQKVIEIKDEESSEQMLKRAMEKRRLAQSKLDSFWKCGKCEFLNHPSRAVCMMCSMPQLDVVHHIMTCPKNELKICPRCKAFVVPYLYDDHVLDCKPIGALDNEKSNQAWYCKLTPCEQNAINHVNGNAIKKSEDNKHKLKLIDIIAKIDNGKYQSEIPQTLSAMYHFLEWKVPIIIRIHIDQLIPKLLHDTHYRNLFEVGKGNGCTNKDTRTMHENIMFPNIYKPAKPKEKPKYGCLNIGMKSDGCNRAIQYGKAYFTLNDDTVRWRVSYTNTDSFSAKGKLGTLGNCQHLLDVLSDCELTELIDTAIYNKKGGINQRTYREIQIHGPLLLDRDIESLHVPKNEKHYSKIYQEFVRKNSCKLIWF
eukprot:240396_1